MIGHRDAVEGEPLPAGRYWIGDLCYVMHDCWNEVCELLFEGRDDYGCNQGTFQLKDGRRFAIYNTQYGDGTYRDGEGREYPVDSGSLGCILLSDISEEERKNTGDGTINEFVSDVFTGRNSEGVVYFNRVQIHTGDNDIDETEWFDEYEEE